MLAAHGIIAKLPNGAPSVTGLPMVVVWCLAIGAVATFVILKLLDVIFGLRVERDQDREGLDLALHGETVA